MPYYMGKFMRAKLFKSDLKSVIDNITKVIRTSHNKQNNLVRLITCIIRIDFVAYYT